MSFGRGGGRGGRGGRGGGGAGRGALADLSLGTLSFADLLATSRADIGDVLYPTAGVNLPVTDLPSNQEAQTVAPAVDRWLYPAYPSSRQRWVIEGDLKPTVGSKKNKQRQSLAKPFIHQFSKLDLQPEASSEDWLYSDRYKAANSAERGEAKQPAGNSTDSSDKSRYLHLMEKSFFPPDLWTSFSEGKKKTTVKKSKSKRATGKSALSGLADDLEGEEDGEKDDKEEEEEVAQMEEEEIDEDDPDYDNNYFDNGDADEGMDSGGEGGDEGGVF
ncbi:hypothetical protein PGT21_028250 [Puccinia graminis f. sp. tritici]|uniref:DNA-directed RNA polymerase III subunit n=2 Tax=Puccinia graminis f. sp. tritici TaxID=56615 RepID=E3K0Q1_PUCGT|nr:uncharacterized protein PGTG_03832 [Puccinia graminis f. sp. tritici CRL 75-36-700-3]EFP77876.2 hypothetical protein PGTG_03832 [Puccinia graminis f. sp. tritici CRL 75-36-700-3]KAA1108881.1 hypothetical protein PGT21_028250 [Puccinia graminis f. sp. tritici]